MNKDLYSYWLSVDGTSEDRKAVFNELSKKENVIGSLLVASDLEFSQYEVPQACGSVEERSEEELDQIFHDVALAVPNAKLTLEAINEDRKLTEYVKRFHGDKYQETRPIISLPPLQEGRDVPFADRAKLLNEPQHRKVYMLCEEMENDDVLRTFTVLAVSEDKDALRQLLKAKVAKDEYGYIADNGTRELGADYFSTNYENDKFVEYYILEEGVQTREQALSLLQTREYSDAFQFPDNFRPILIAAINAYTADENYGALDSDKIADALLADMSFRSALRKNFWFNEEHISDANTKRGENMCYYFLSDKLLDEPDFFDKLCVIPSVSLPGNLKDIVIDNLYDAAKALHLPISNLEDRAAHIMRNVDFLQDISAAAGEADHLDPGTATYDRVSAICMKQVIADIQRSSVPLDQALEKGRSLDALIKQAEARTVAPQKNLSAKDMQK